MFNADDRRAKKPRLPEADGFARMPRKTPLRDQPKPPIPQFISDFAPAARNETPSLDKKTRVHVKSLNLARKPKNADPSSALRHFVLPSSERGDSGVASSSSRHTIKQPPPPISSPMPLLRGSSSSASRPLTTFTHTLLRPEPGKPPSTPPKRKSALMTRAFAINVPSSNTAMTTKPMKSISATRLARAMDITNEDGAAEILGFFLQQSGSASYTADSHQDITRGLEITPHKGKGGLGKSTRFLRGGLAEQGHENLGRGRMALTLWRKEIASQIASVPQTSAHLLVQIERVVWASPLPPPPRGPAGSRLCLAVCSLMDSNGISSETICVLFSFSPGSTVQSDGDGVFTTDYSLQKHRKVAIWKPWYTLDKHRAFTWSTEGNGDIGALADVGVTLLCSRFRTF